MNTFDAAHELLQPGESALFVHTDGRHFTINADGSGSTGFWVISPRRQVDRVVVVREKRRGAQRFSELFTALHDGVIPHTDGKRYTVRLLSIQLAGSTERSWRQFVDAGQNPVRYISKPVA